MSSILCLDMRDMGLIRFWRIQALKTVQNWKFSRLEAGIKCFLLVKMESARKIF